MAGESPILTRVRAAAKLLDDDALAALANKGLVRRARKDLQAHPPKLSDAPADKVLLQVEDCIVDLAQVPSQSRCTCPATGMCRHILAALLFLRESASEIALSAGAGFAAEEVLALTDDMLQAWAGKPTLRKALQALALSLPVEFEESAALLARFPTWNVTCRWLPGAGLAGIICSCHSVAPCEHRVAAVLAYQVAKGRRRILLEDASLEASARAPRTRAEVLASVGGVLREMVALGLSRLSRSTADRLRTLAVSAHGVDLPRLERMLRALADEIALTLSRDAQATSGNLLATASRIEALRVAVANPLPDFVGVHRSRYEKVGDIELVGLGARQWRTRSGYVGLTAYFWDRSMKGWVTWTDARPVSVAGFNPVDRYRQDGPWVGCESPLQASRHVIRLMGAWRNRAGRLSGRPATRCLTLGATDASQTPTRITAWPDLRERAARLFGGGLRERSEQDEIVLVQPARWGPTHFDPIHQEFQQPIFDAAGNAIAIVVPHTPQTESAIPILECHDSAKTWGMLGLLRLHHGRPALEPITLLRDTLVHVTLDGMPSAKTPPAAPPAIEHQQDQEEEIDLAEEPAITNSPVGLLLGRAAAQLESISEGGLRAVRDAEALRKLASELTALGMTTVVGPIARLAEQLDRLRKSMDLDASTVAGMLLQADYVVRFAAMQEAVAEATSFLGSG
jgi:hypothetical protein